MRLNRAESLPRYAHEMGDVTKLGPGKPRRIGETTYTDSGLRLGPVRKVVDSGWFLPMIVTVPIAAFVLAFFW